MMKVRVPAGTRVSLELAETLSPEATYVGDKVDLRVTHDVVIDGKVVVEMGAAAAGEVAVATKKGSIGKPAEIGVSVKSITAVDGTKISASAYKVIEGEDKQTLALVVGLALCILGLLIKGGDAYLFEGTQIEATTASNVEVEVE
jgi:hypothetical protein